MVQQLSLASSFRDDQLNTVEKTLQALTGLRSEPLSRHTVILKPKFPYTPDSNAKLNQVESYRVRMTRVWESDGQWTGESVFDNNAITDSIWTIQLSDIPAGGNRPVSIQNIHEATIYKTDDIMGYMDELGYMPETEFWSKGQRFYYNDAVIELFRLYVKNQTSTDKLVVLKLLDGSGSWQVRSFVNVSKLNDLDSVTKGVKELEALKKDLTGLIDLQVPDRADMDSRIGSRIAARGRS